MAVTCKEARERLGRRPKAKLGFFPTPFYKLENLSEKLGVNLYIKRDDFTGMSLFGGNKIRKLEYLIGEAVEQGCDYVFTYGATQSNHAMQTVTACRRYGLHPVIYLVAIVKPDEEDIRSNLLLDRIMGAEIHIVEMLEGETEADAEERSFVMAREHIARLEKEGHKCYDVPMGGASPAGSLGFVEGFVELEEQLEQMNLKMDYIFHATGTGGTMAGLAAGKKLVGSAAKIISVNVSEKNSGYPAKCAELANDSLKLIGTERLVDEKEDIHTDLNYYLPGYEIPNQGATEAIRMLAREEGLFLDPVYTGKAFAGLIDYIRTGKVEQGSNVMFWHTGGATALFAEKEILGEVAGEE
ncbi:pyridoxal-phosphate dependent enzyme [Clostridium sp. MCC353]|uniref:D-cysteine desulfhydrase family protein n=1 Tax=Clostridium sp. MCC353 TaxID=2592646 RepID=UPI001C012753|nr:D-cysteine desulfhydrase family protein [Clostridium sp. MCC353]MBT9779977.1 pyridoxal-phosphate dependent enzyme [Clostridium sp. MCC353]